MPKKADLRKDFKEVIFRECSAKTGEGVQELYEDICRSLLYHNVCHNNNVRCCDEGSGRRHRSYSSK